VKITKITLKDHFINKLILRHNVEQAEVVEVFNNRPRFRFVEKGHQEGENVYRALGQTDAGRYLIVFFIYKAGNEAFVISARNMTDKEKKSYERK
jgi:uncharacterized protein